MATDQTLNSAALNDYCEILKQLEESLRLARMKEVEFVRYGSLFMLWVDVMRAHSSLRSYAITVAIEEESAEREAKKVSA